MSGLIEHKSIPKKVATQDDLDFFFLKEKGIEYIEELGGALWTDLNSHDPGITMLEMLCYAITDLGNRIGTPLENLLTPEEPNKTIEEQFYKAEEVFPNKPVNELDYRKVFIDLEGVRNCWLRTFDKTVYVNCRENELTYNSDLYADVQDDFKTEFKLRGLYSILVEFEVDEELTEEEKKTQIDEIKASIKKKYHQYRNLCEDLAEIKEVETQEVKVCADIEVEKEADEEEVHANVLFEIEKYFSPTVRFRSLKEMIDDGKTTDEIFDGPLLNNGFIDTDELIEADLRNEVRLSDLMKIIMGIKGVKLIRDISIGHCDPEIEQKNDWLICIKPNKKPVLCEMSAFSYHKGVLPLNINEKRVTDFLDELKEEEDDLKELAKKDKTLKLPQGVYSGAKDYTTILNDFPDTYGIGQEGLGARATTQRKSQAKQLKSYLLFFDKILASYFQHLYKVKDLLSINGEETETFFSQALSGIKDFDELVKGYPETNEEITELVFQKFDNDIDRRNQIIDHLLSRFAESFGDYAFLMNMLYGSAAEEVTLNNKRAFLKDYIAISSERGCAFNYYQQPHKNLWNTENISGFQKRVSRLVGVKDYSRRHLTASFVKLKEHIDGDKKTYSWQIVDNDGIEVLKSVRNFKSISRASNSLYNAVLLITQTTEENIDALFKGNTLVNFKLTKPNVGKYSWSIIDLEVAKDHTDYVLAEHGKEYGNLTLLKEKILELIQFIKHDFTEEGMFLVEHILLRPDITDNNASSDQFMPICADDCEDGCGLDPYSFKVSIVLPGFTYRFSNPDFRNYMENIIREELPAHIVPRICWVGSRREEEKDEDNDLWQFENAYKEYLKAKTMLDQQQPTSVDNKHNKLIMAMMKLNTIYPIGRLLDCSDESDEIEGRVILGQTNLGTLKIESNGD
jgi:hypothetical protein